jgi:iron complex transport system permease protein
MMNANRIETIKTGRKKRLRRQVIVIAVLGVLLIGLAVSALSLGNVRYPISVITRVLSGETIKGASFAIVTLRLPRMLAGLLIGMAFGISGSAFQTLLRNSLASPDIIGISSGASAAAVVCILVFRWSGFAVSAAAVTAGLATATLIYILSRGGAFSGRLILIGLGIGAMLQAVISYLLLRASQYDIPAALRWLSGSLNGVHMEELVPLAVSIAVFFPLLILLGKQLEFLELGDEKASSLGIRVNRTRLLLILCAVGLVAFATAVAGPIAFVAFLSGPIARRMSGSGSPALLSSALTGAALTLAADLAGQFAFDTKFPVGVVTGIIGAPYLLFLLVRINRSGGSS